MMTLLIFSTIGNANEAVFIKKNESAPFSGFIFSEQHAREIRKELIEKDIATAEVQSARQQLKNFSRIIELKDEEIESYASQNQRLLKYKESSDNMKYVWFGLGIVVTGIAVYSAQGLSR